MAMRRQANIIGRNIARFRFQQGWTQTVLAAKMQLLGCYMTREIIANVETCRSAVTDKRIAFFAVVFGVSVNDLFPKRPVPYWPVDQ